MLMWNIQIGRACWRARLCRYAFLDVLLSGLPFLSASIQSRCLHPIGTSTWDDWEEWEHFSLGAFMHQTSAIILFLFKMQMHHRQTSQNWSISLYINQIEHHLPNVILSANLWKGFGLTHDQVRLALFKFQKVSTVRMSQERPNFLFRIWISAWKQTHTQTFEDKASAMETVWPAMIRSHETQLTSFMSSFSLTQ